MSFPRLTCLILPLALGLPLLVGACAAPLGVTAASYGADGVSVVETGKTGADHLTSMVSKKDCAVLRTFKNQDICRDREGGRDPYDVNYNEPFRQAGEGGVEYAPPPHAAADAPAASWDAAAYQTPTQSSSAALPAAAPSSPPPQPVAASVPTSTSKSPAPAPAKPKKHVTGRTKTRHKPIRKKPAPGPAESAL
ncbi:hypothetical protein SAMN02745126_01034 [Enhydrobacter aerosaccus]|uniref:Uncharacterized protein n=1 Tax=Enhydrobacter aerosaccus TaxID=225324 RepID=A0A1T4KLJ4_9HYPH|nr:hypothetical protein [Enhydrobacter aerosaccus]SJZ43276.1 hypothetical protein SAMN02745126_01034 [Enhydrobacter aerosaccus]